jgi:hypothetical protein
MPSYSGGTMKKIMLLILIMVTPVFCFHTSFAEEMKYNYEVEFGSAKGEKILQINGSGKVNITGYDGNKILFSSDDDVFKDDGNNEKAKGLKKIAKGGFNIINNKEKNIIVVSRPGYKEVDLDVKVPNNTTLKIGTGVTKPSNGFNLSHVQMIAPSAPKAMAAPEFENKVEVLVKRGDETEKHTRELEKEAEKLEKKIIMTGPPGKDVDTSNGAIGFFYQDPLNGSVEGDIVINDFKGLVEASTVQGSITVNNLDGMILANAFEGDIHVVFKKLVNGKELYLSTVNGDIDITFPENTDADVMAKTIEGDVYSGFDGDVAFGQHPDGKQTSGDSGNSPDNVFQSDYVATRINKGGQDVYLNTVEGSIYIRKGE